MKSWIHSFLSLLFPRYCAVCGHLISHTEEYLCITCMVNIPRTYDHLQKGNLLEEFLSERMTIERAVSFFHYRRDSDYRHIVFELKYRGLKHMGEVMGRYMALEIVESGFFDGIDAIIPVPLHKKRLKERGYNQSEWIAHGIQQVAAIPIHSHVLIRKKYTKSQTGKHTFERKENVKDIFELQQPDRLEGKHILLVDDVLTTGATIMACASALSPVKGIRISVLTLGVSF